MKIKVVGCQLMCVLGSEDNHKPCLRELPLCPKTDELLKCHGFEILATHRKDIFLTNLKESVINKKQFMIQALLLISELFLGVHCSVL